MPQAVDFLSSRIVTMEAESRLSDAAEAIRAKNATHCAVLDSAEGRFFGIVRLVDAALLPSQRIAADLIAPDPPPVVPETADLRQVAEQLRKARAEEAVVLSKDGRFLGVITREGLLDWALREHDRAQNETAQFRQALKEAEHYATFAAHDLRAPLRAIQCFADILADSNPALDATGRGYLERIRAASRRLDALMEAFLEESRGVSGKEGSYTTNLDEAVNEALALCEQLIAESGAEVTVSAPLHSVQGRPAVVVRIVANLLTNAIRHAPPVRPPLVRISSAVRGEEIWLSVRDNGAGMPESFRPGSGESAANAPGKDSQGLGLLIVERAVNRLGGALALESSPGQGSTFTVRLPRAGAPRP